MRHVPPKTIDTGSTPLISCIPLRRHPFYDRYIGENVCQMLKQELIEESSFNFSFPVVLASKPNGKIRFCIDYRRLNSATIQDAYKLPRLDDILDPLHVMQ